MTLSGDDYSSTCLVGVVSCGRWQGVPLLVTVQWSHQRDQEFIIAIACDLSVSVLRDNRSWNDPGRRCLVLL